VEAIDPEQIAAVLQAAAVLLVRHLSYGESITSALVLTLLAEDGPVRVSVLATASGVSQPSMTELVGRLVREGLVTRLSDPEDGRATLVDITASGRTLLLQRRRSRHNRLTELLEMLPAEDVVTLSLAMRVAAPFIRRLIQLAAQQPQSPGELAPLMT
jgi:DNA-binding MarR family transcriptional regulator